jgi:prepilin-type N-terminal cleavage/methylation domain-containing protein/prepilin-type processing-associated H-X9-DG protein
MRKAFTLLELLVVIAVITLLLGILMPALSTAKSQAKAAVCQSNLRQLTLANTGYATENEAYYVPAASDLYYDTTGGCHRWHGVRSGPDESFDPLKGPLIAYLSSGKIKECPERVRFRKGQSWNESFEKGNGGYGYNMTYIGSLLWQSNIITLEDLRKACKATTRITEVARPAETLMFADCAMSMDNGVHIEYSFAEPPFLLDEGQPNKSWGYTSPSIHFRHRGKANVAWSDGHIDARKMADYDGINVYGVKSADMMLGWFEPIDNTPFDLK